MKLIYYRFRDIYYRGLLERIIGMLSIIIDYTAKSGKHIGFVQANLSDALEDCANAANDWHTDPSTAHEFDIQSRGLLVENVPCDHPGCLQHVSHPCEKCGRIQGRNKIL